METMEQGDVIFRPSSKGEDRLTVTWKVTDGVYQHIDVLEKGKINAFSLGSSLWIGTEEYEDLDEIMARFVNPVSTYMLIWYIGTVSIEYQCKEMTNVFLDSRYFRI